MKKMHKLNFSVVALTATLFVVIAVFVALSTRKMMVDEARSTVENVVKAAVGRIDTLMAGVESAVDNSAWIVRENLSRPDYMVRVAHELVLNNDFVVGSAVAFVPDYFPGKPRLFAPYCNNDATGGVRVAALEYEYAEESDRNEWFVVPRRLGRAHWSEPYFDDGGGEMMMCTYSQPIKDAAGKVVAVLTADISLADLTHRVAALRPYADSYAVMRSTGGRELVPPPKDMARVRDVVNIVGRSSNGWTVELVCPLENILRGAKALVFKIVLFSLIGLGLIFFVSWSFSSRLQRATAATQRIQSELSIAREIQTGLVKTNFPDYATARMRPAKEVGGDRYDFIARDGVDHFAIGDASGKGVPAALYTSLVGAGFRLTVGMDLPLEGIVGSMNDLVSANNDTAMFVTCFIGRFDRAAGRLDYCNAGHNPPVVIAPDGSARPLEVRCNVVLGAMDGYPYKPQTTQLEPGSKLLLYTDGVTEAMTADGAQYGLPRLLEFAAAHAKDDVGTLADAVLADVDAFAAGAPQADDITVMVIRT